MARRPIQLGRPELAAEIAERYRKAKTGWQKTRLLCAKLASEGQHQSAQIAALCGCGTSRLFDWLKMLREGDLEGLLQRDKPAPPHGRLQAAQRQAAHPKATPRGLAGRTLEDLAAVEPVAQGEARLGSQNQHGAQLVKKSAGCCGCHGPGIPREAANVAMEQFKASLGQKLDALQLPQGTPSKGLGDE